MAVRQAGDRRDRTGKLLLERIEMFENGLGDVCQQMNMYIQKLAKLRDEGDSLANVLLKLAEQESIANSLKQGVTMFAENIAAIQDYRDAQIQRLEVKVLGEFSTFGDQCITAKESAKKLPALKDREVVKHGKTDSESNNSRMAKLQIERFEQKKIADTKKILEEFIKIELAFHAKAINMLTMAFNGVLAIDLRLDMMSFRKAFDFPLPETVTEPKNVSSQSKLRRFSSTPEISGQQGDQLKKLKERAYESDDDISLDSGEITPKPRPAARKSSNI